MSVLNTPADPRHEVDNPMASGWLRSVPLAAVILGLGIVAANYTSLPDQVPTHFNSLGEVDGYGHKAILWGLPLLNFGLFGLLSWSVKMDFKWFNYPVDITEENAAEQHRIGLEMIAFVRVIVCVMFAYLAYALVRSAQTETSVLNMWVFGGFLVALFASIGWGLKQAFDAK